MNAPRIAPLDPPYTTEIQQAFDRIMPPGMEPLKIFRTFAHHPELLKKVTALGGVLLNQGVLPPREREILLLRTCARWGAEYEWGVHVNLFAQPLGFTEADIAATAGPADDPAWTPDERLLIHAADALIDHGVLPDALWEALATRYGVQALLEILGVVGCYTAIAFMLNGCAVTNESWAARFPGHAATGA